jgi:hypothetical protein
MFTRVRVVLAALTLVLASTAAGVFGASPAQAMCWGTNGYTASVYIYVPNTSIPSGFERSQRASTCDGLSDYYGFLQDLATDGYCAYAYYYDPSQTTQGRSCDSGGANYRFFDPQGNSYAWWDLCSGPPGTVRCASYQYADDLANTNRGF